MTKVYSIDVESGEEILRDMTSAEEADYQKLIAAAKALKEEEAKTEAAKAALLTKLGITSDEAKLLLS